MANGISIGSAVFAGLTVVTNKQTQTTLRSNNPHLALMSAMWTKKYCNYSNTLY